MVAVTGSLRKPVVLDRRKIETADAAIRGSKQPYHAAGGLEFGAAEALIHQCCNSSVLLATSAVRTMVAELAQGGYNVVGAGIVYAAGRPLPELAAILRSHALIHTAEGEFFRDALVRASENCRLPVTKVKEREAWERAAALSHLDVNEVQQRVDELRRSLGPPWRQDEKLASLAAWIALGATAR
jgi:hypothetical protein